MNINEKLKILSDWWFRVYIVRTYGINSSNEEFVFDDGLPVKKKALILNRTCLADMQCHQHQVSFITAIGDSKETAYSNLESRLKIYFNSASSNRCISFPTLDEMKVELMIAGQNVS